jgi:1-pyrroline-5-carboxylate dehydrogenase
MAKLVTPSKKAAAKKTAARARNGSSDGIRGARPAAFKLTYSTMFNPPETMHAKYDRALAGVKANFGRDYGMIINNQDVFADAKFDDRSPIDTAWLLGTFQKGGPRHADQALAAAQAAWPKWAGLKWKDRVRLMRRVAQQI